MKYTMIVKRFFFILFYGKINLSRMRPKNRWESERKTHPKWIPQPRQTPTFQRYPLNHENSEDGGDAGAHPLASPKHPISNKCPWGLAKVWRKAPSICIWEAG